MIPIQERTVNTAQQVRRIEAALNERLGIIVKSMLPNEKHLAEEKLRDLALDIYQAIADSVSNDVETGVVSFLSGGPLPYQVGIKTDIHGDPILKYSSVNVR